MNHGRTLLTMAVCASLTACGGGGSDGHANDKEGPASAPRSAAGQQGVTEYSAYAKPAGALCAQTTTDLLTLEEVCNEPTSSSISEQQLNRYLLDPQGKTVRFSLTGFDSVSTPQQLSYVGMSTKDVYLGAGRIRFDGRTYGSSSKTWDITPNFYALIAGGDTTRQLTLNVEDGLLGIIQLIRSDLTFEDIAEHLPVLSQAVRWETMLSLRTDWKDAPQERILVYEGGITITGGLGGDVQLSDGRWVSSQASGDCHVKATVDVLYNDVSIEVDQCVGTDVDGSTMVAVEDNQARFKVEGSRISRGLAPTSVSVGNGLLGVAVSGASVNDVTGGIYGTQARTLRIHGRTAGARFDVIALRVVETAH